MGTGGGSWNDAGDGTHNNAFQFYQEDICLSGISMIAFLHPDLTDWQANLNWFVQQTILRTSTTSGWRSGYPTHIVKIQDTGSGPYYVVDKSGR